jgi:hypothetical protein
MAKRRYRRSIICTVKDVQQAEADLDFENRVRKHLDDGWPLEAALHAEPGGRRAKFYKWKQFQDMRRAQRVARFRGLQSEHL